MLRLSEACKRLGIHPNTLRKWDGRGKIRVVRTVGGRRRMPESEVERLIGIVKPDALRRTVIYCSFPLMIKSGMRLGWPERNHVRIR